MSAIPTQTDAERDKEEALHYRAMVRKLADMAMEMAELTFKGAKTPSEPGTPNPDRAAQFERASRTVRRAILLARKLAEPLPRPRRAKHPLPVTDRTAARKHIVRDVEDTIDREHRSNLSDVETLEAERLERLDRLDLEYDLAHDPIGDIIADLARDLGGGGVRSNERSRAWKPHAKQDIAGLDFQDAAPLPTEPCSPRTTSPIPLPWHRRTEHPEDDAEAGAMVLAIKQIRDG